MPSARSEQTLGPRLPELRTLLLDLVLRVQIKRKAGRDVTEDGLRKVAASFRDSAKEARMPSSITVAHVEVAGRPAEWVKTAEGGARVILYFHGGGFFFSSPREHRPLIWRLARATGRRVLAIDYRKAPDHAFPAWLDDAAAAYEHLLAEGVAPKDIVLSGDSAGGNIALALVHRLRHLGRPLPDALVLFSPWADLTCGGRTYRTKHRRDAMFRGDGARSLGLFLTRACDPYDPEVSPLNGDYRGFPRMLVFAGSTEVFLDDARAVVRKATSASVDARLIVFRHMPHVFPMFAAIAPRAKQAFPIIRDFLAEP
jgi:acetyl esterase/lipase